VNTPSPLPIQINSLIEALRDELQQYGEMLALLDQQQEHITQRAADEVLHSAVAVTEQMDRIRAARAQRETRQRELAAALQCEPDASFANLLPRLPQAYQPAVSALVQENNDLLARVQQRARQNHLLLCRAVELMQQFVQGLAAAHPPPIYTGCGLLQPSPTPPSPIYEAVG
jgi:flagellar biosynthesis/type III secretory pathway chaperone